MIAYCNLWSRTNTASTRWNEQFKRSKMRSLWHWLQRIAIFPSNCGINLHSRSKKHSIYCALCASTQQNWRMKSITDHTTGTGTPWPHSDAKPRLQRWQYTRFMGIAGSQRMVPWTIQGPLPMWSLLYHWNPSLPYIWVDKIVPATLLTSRHDLHQHLRALTEELAEATAVASNTPKGKRLLKFLVQIIEDLLHPAPPIEEQRVGNKERLARQTEEQRVINETLIITIPRITDLPPILTSHNPPAKQKLKGTKCLHRQVTWNNTPSIMPDSVIRDHLTTTHQQLPWTIQQTHAINILTLMEKASFSTTHTPRALTKNAKMPINFEHSSEVALCPLLPWYSVKSSWNIRFRDYQHVFYLEKVNFHLGKDYFNLISPSI